LFFASGCAALVYELVWFHFVQLVVGASSLSVAVILASFMGGMALGSALLPRWVTPARHPLRVVAGLELGIGAIGLAMPFVLPFVEHGYLALVGYGYAGVLLRAGVATLVLLPPTLLMGATLPAIARWTAATSMGASAVGLLYTANIAGAAAGTLLAGFYLLRVYDTVVASTVAATINFTIAALAWWLAARHPLPRHDDHTEAPHPPHLPHPPHPPHPPHLPHLPHFPVRVFLAAALSGLTALGAEVVWTRQLSLLMGASVYTFSLILAVFLAGLGLGSLAGSALSRRSADPARLLGVCQWLLAPAIAFGAWAIVEVLPLGQPTRAFLPGVRSSLALSFTFDACRASVAMLPAAALWGASFPLALAAVAGGADAGRAVARINALNTLGSLAGAVGFTLVGIPLLGSERAQHILVLLAVLSGLIVLRPLFAPRALAAAAGVAGAAIWLVPAVPGPLIAYGRSVDSWSSIKRLLYVAEGPVASVAVTEGIAGARQFHIAGKVEASDMDVDMRLERMLGHVPALVHPRPRKVLVVGAGAGITAGAIAMHPEVERIVICEIEPVVPASARAYFAAENHRVLDDPRTEVVYDDARHFLQTTSETFDIITSDPIHPWVRGAAALYSLEYLELVRARLEPGGVVTQWVPLYETDVPSVKSELATFARVFPDMTLWNPDLLEEGYDLVALGRVEGGAIDEEAMGRRIERSAAVRTSLEEVTLPSAGAILATYAGRARDLAPWLADATINRDRHLRLQYLAGLAANTDQRFLLFQTIVGYRRYPADLFAASAETEGQLRRWYLP
jgi:spermidine synthase